VPWSPETGRRVTTKAAFSADQAEKGDFTDAVGVLTPDAPSITTRARIYVVQKARDSRCPTPCPTPGLPAVNKTPHPIGAISDVLFVGMGLNPALC
jgi:hypothetical protein